MPIREAIARLISPPPEPVGPDPRVAELQARVEKLEKRLGMAMGALQAGTAQITNIRKATEEALSTARQATQLATTARSTAESVAEGLEALESGPTADTTVLDGSVRDVKAALSTGSFDQALDSLQSAEQTGKNRKGVLAAIDDRRG